MPPRRSNEDISTLGHLNLIEISRESARWGVTGAVEESDGIMLFASGSSLPVICNGAFRTDDTVDPVELVTRADAFFGGRGRGYTVMVRDQPADDDLRRACSAQGLLAFGDPSPEMSCTKRVEAVPSTDVDLRWVADDGEVADFARVAGNAYGTYGMPADVPADFFSAPHRLLGAPNVHVVLAYDGSEAVAGAMSVLSHGIAGIYWVGTVESARGRGLGRLVTTAVTNDALDRGASAVTLQASDMGEPIYRSMGYEALYFYTNWVRFEAPKP